MGKITTAGFCISHYGMHCVHNSYCVNFCFFALSQVRAKPGAGSCPLQMVAYWKCEDSHTDLRLDYKYNAHTMATPSALLNLSVAVPIDGGVKNMQSQPNGSW